MASRNRGKGKLKLRDLSRLRPSTEEHNKLAEQFARYQPPIVTAILGQALVENELDQLLRTHFTKRDDDTWAKLTDEKGPLATFCSKIIAAHAFGICNDVVRDCLNTVRQIRNAFAHSKKPLDFSHELIVKELKNVTLPDKKRSNLYKELRWVREAAAERQKGPQGGYVMLCMIIKNALLDKKTARMKSKTRRLSKRLYRLQLETALKGYPPEPPRGALTGLLRNQIDDPRVQAQKPSRKKLGR